MLADCVSPVSIYLAITDNPALRSACALILNDVTPPTQLSAARYLLIFCLTCLLEAPVYWIFVKPELRWSRRIALVLIVNLTTHPLVTWVFPPLFLKIELPYKDMIFAAELFAPVTEALILLFVFKQGWRRSTLAAVLANLFSWWFGPYIALKLISH